MILFKRIRDSIQAIERRDWTLLSIETLGVLLGIFIAFELNEWAASRREAQHQRRLIERLFEETQETVTLLRQERDLVTGFTDAERGFALALVNDHQCPAPQMWKSLESIGFYPPVGVPTSVYSEMMGAGGLASIENEGVRRAISKFHSLLDHSNKQNDFARAAYVPPYDPEDERVTIRLGPKANRPLATSFDRPALCASAAFRNRLAVAVRNHEIASALRRRLTKDAIIMCAAVGQLLDRRCEPRSGGPLQGPDAQAVDSGLKMIASQ